jgi:hypothetical protein
MWTSGAESLAAPIDFVAPPAPYVVNTPAESDAWGPRMLHGRGAAYRSPVVAAYDPETGKLPWGDNLARAAAGFMTADYRTRYDPCSRS